MFFNRSSVELKPKNFSFRLKPTYTSIDNNGAYRYYKNYKIQDSIKVYPFSNADILLEFESVSKYSEVAYLNLFSNDTIILYQPSVKEKLLFKYELIGDNKLKNK